MNLPLGFGELDFSDWLRGLVAAFIGGGASAITSGLVVSLQDPKDFSMGSAKFFDLVGSVFVMAGAMNAFAFLRNRPIPEVKHVEKTIEQTKTAGQPQVTVTTIKETSVEPKIPPIA